MERAAKRDVLAKGKGTLPGPFESNVAEVAFGTTATLRIA